MIEGSLRDVPLADVFQVVVAGRKDGALEVVRGPRTATLSFVDGALSDARLDGGTVVGPAAGATGTTALAHRRKFGNRSGTPRSPTGRRATARCRQATKPRETRHTAAAPQACPAAWDGAA